MSASCIYNLGIEIVSARSIGTVGDIPVPRSSVGGAFSLALKANGMCNPATWSILGVDWGGLFSALPGAFSRPFSPVGQGWSIDAATGVLSNANLTHDATAYISVQAVDSTNAALFAVAYIACAVDDVDSIVGTTQIDTGWATTPLTPYSYSFEYLPAVVLPERYVYYTHTTGASFRQAPPPITDIYAANRNTGLLNGYPRRAAAYLFNVETQYWAPVPPFGDVNMVWTINSDYRVLIKESSAIYNWPNWPLP